MKKNRVLILPVEDIENAFVLVSFQQRDMKETYGEFRVRSIVSFVYQNGDKAAEWEAENGPIQIWTKCDPDYPNAREHYFFDYVIDEWGNWSQLAVDNNNLPEAANRGDLKHIFSVLKDWAS